MLQEDTFPPRLGPASEEDASGVLGQADAYVHFPANGPMRIEQRGARHVVAVSTEATSLARKILFVATPREKRAELFQDCSCDGKSDAVSACVARSYELLSRVAPEFLKPLPIVEPFQRDAMRRMAMHDLRHDEPVLAARYECGLAANAILDSIYSGE